MSRYPTLSYANAVELASTFLTSGPRDLTESEVTWRGKGEVIDLPAIEEAAQQVSEELDDYIGQEGSESDKDLLEGRVTPIVHEALKHLDVRILDDPGFWRYLTFDLFWDFVYWREEERFAKNPPEKYLLYLDAKHPTECVLTRTFLRGNAIGSNGDYSLAEIEKAGDFWRSHILRVSIGSSGALSRAFAAEQQNNRRTTEDLREFARRLNRHATNLVLPLVNDEDAASLVAEINEQIPND